jgi:hypothetical protein
MVRIDANRITDRASFHSVFAEAIGFPNFYGRNMDAWIDCMTHLDDPGDGLSKVHIEPGEVLSLVIDNASDFKKRCPGLFADLVECAAFVNWRRIERGRPPVLALALYT